MSDLVERLRKKVERFITMEATHTKTLEWEAAARIEQLEGENASLASWQCEFTDGKTGLVYGEGGSTYCAMAKRVQKLEAALRPLACTCKAKHQAECSRAEVDCPFWNVRAALEERT